MIPTTPQQNRLAFDNHHPDTDSGNIVYSMTEIRNNFVFFNSGNALFHPDDDEASQYGVNKDLSWVKNSDGTFINPQIWPTNGGYKKAIIVNGSNTDIGFFSFRASNTVDGDELSRAQRVQMHVRSAIPGQKYYSTIGENRNANTLLRRGKSFEVLPIRISNGAIIDNGNQTSPGQRGVSLLELFTENHPLPQDDGYYVFIFSFGYMKYSGQSSDDSRYNLFYAKVA